MEQELAIKLQDNGIHFRHETSIYALHIFGFVRLRDALVTQVSGALIGPNPNCSVHRNLRRFPSQVHQSRLLRSRYNYWMRAGEEISVAAITR